MTSSTSTLKGRSLGNSSQETSPASSAVRVRFVGARGGYNSVATQAVRIHEGMRSLDDPSVASELLLLPRGGMTSRFPGWRAIKTPWSRLTRDVDIVVVVKPSLFWQLDRSAASLKGWCARKGVILVSAPADGAAGESRSRPDVFTNEIADYVLTISGQQYDEIVTHRDASTVFPVASATRPSLGAAIGVRERVRTVVWENPPHHDPNFNPAIHGIDGDTYVTFERKISALCEANGAVLMTLSSWRDDRSDREWEELLLGADIAIECKSLDRCYAPNQLAKPPIKLQNYLALGLPTVCDSLPSHVDTGREAGVLFADTLEQWEQQLLRLFESAVLRSEMSRSARKAVAHLSVESVCRQYLECFNAMLGRSRTRTATTGERARTLSQSGRTGGNKRGGDNARLC